jgi:hypothetical protein
LRYKLEHHSPGIQLITVEPFVVNCLAFLLPPN